MSYNKYPKEMKEAVIARLIEDGAVVMDIHRETGIGINTLYRWRDEALNARGLSATTKYKNDDKWSGQVKEWRDACINANANNVENNAKASKELRAERKERERVEKELARKEKALAEAAALLVLRKKADAIWGMDEKDE